MVCSTITSSPSNSIQCRTGLTTMGKESAIWIESPRTSRRIAIPRGLYKELPSRIAGRIAQAAGRGVHLLSFTPEELKAAKAVHDEYRAAIQAAAEEELSNLRAANDASAVPSALGNVIQSLPEKLEPAIAVNTSVEWYDEHGKKHFAVVRRITEDGTQAMVQRADLYQFWIRSSKLSVSPAVPVYEDRNPWNLRPLEVVREEARLARQVSGHKTWEDVWRENGVPSVGEAPQS